MGLQMKCCPAEDLLNWDDSSNFTLKLNRLESAMIRQGNKNEANYRVFFPQNEAFSERPEMLKCCCEDFCSAGENPVCGLSSIRAGRHWDAGECMAEVSLQLEKKHDLLQLGLSPDHQNIQLLHTPLLQPTHPVCKQPASVPCTISWLLPQPLLPSQKQLDEPMEARGPHFLFPRRREGQLLFPQLGWMGSRAAPLPCPPRH